MTACTAADELQSCVARADRALYMAKAAGRDRVVLLLDADTEAEVAELQSLAVLD